MRALRGPAAAAAAPTEVDGRHDHGRGAWTSVFLAGLGIGALVGAAIAGSSIWGYRRAGATHGQSELREGGPRPAS